jgi:hypothetical protein
MHTEKAVLATSLVKWSAGVSEKPSPRECHRDGAKDLALREFREGGFQLIEYEVWLAKLFDRKHLETHIREHNNVSSVMFGIGVVGECFGGVCHEVATFGWYCLQS